MKHHILLVDDDKLFRDTTSKLLSEEGFVVRAVESGDEAVAHVRQSIVSFSLALIDFHMPGMNGPEVISQVKSLNPNLEILGLSGDDSTEAHNQTLDSGAEFFIKKGLEDAKLLAVLHRVCRNIERRTKPLALMNETQNKDRIARIGMVGVSNSMAEVADLVERFSNSRESVLIRGEHGTGKEKVAHAVHLQSSRRLQPFIAVNCGGIPEHLIESELFGHEKGSFTGATRDRIGHFQAAQGGTIFLDEIGELPLHLQATLLRVLQEKAIKPVGLNITKKIDFRLIAATNAPLEQLIEKKRFREDLYYRINVLPIHLAPLRERPEDIPYLASAFLAQANQEEGQNKAILESTVEEFKKRYWAGNVRELQHCIKCLVNISPGPFLDESLSKAGLATSFTRNSFAPDLSVLRDEKQYEEAQLIQDKLERSPSVSAAAKALNISRSTLRDKIKKYGIQINKSNSKVVHL